jgi:hypothetical protein
MLQNLFACTVSSLPRKRTDYLPTSAVPTGITAVPPSVPSRDRNEHVRQLLDERRLLLHREHQVAVALCLMRKRREDPAPDTEVDRTHVRPFFCPFQAQSDPLEIREGRACGLPSWHPSPVVLLE